MTRLFHQRRHIMSATAPLRAEIALDAARARQRGVNGGPPAAAAPADDGESRAALGDITAASEWRRHCSPRSAASYKSGAERETHSVIKAARGQRHAEVRLSRADSAARPLGLCVAPNSGPTSAGFHSDRTVVAKMGFRLGAHAAASAACDVCKLHI